MEKIDLKNLTQLELLELREQVKYEINSYGNREKKPAYTIKQLNQNNRYFSKKKNANSAIMEMIDDDCVFSNDYTIFTISYLTTEEWKELCEDLS